MTLARSNARACHRGWLSLIGRGNLPGTPDAGRRTPILSRCGNDHVGREAGRSILHHVNVILMSDTPDNLSRERDLDDVKVSTKLAETILAGNATDEDRQRVKDQVHPQVRSLYGL